MNLFESIKKYSPINQQEARDKEVMLQFMRHNENYLERSNFIAHFTASIWTVNKEPYLAEAEEQEELVINEQENQDVKWFTFEEARRCRMNHGWWNGYTRS